MLFHFFTSSGGVPGAHPHPRQRVLGFSPQCVGGGSARLLSRLSVRESGCPPRLGGFAMSRELISQSEFARRVGVSRAAVRSAVRDGRIVLVEPHDGSTRWLVDPVQALQATGWSGEAASKFDVPPLHESEKAAKHWLALKRRLEYEREAGELVRADAIAQEAFTVARRIRDGLERLPARVAQLVAPVTDPRECAALMETEIRAVLEALAGEVEKQPAQPAHVPEPAEEPAQAGPDAEADP